MYSGSKSSATVEGRRNSPSKLWTCPKIRIPFSCKVSLEELNDVKSMVVTWDCVN